jgi:hypothetical protein
VVDEMDRRLVKGEEVVVVSLFDMHLRPAALVKRDSGVMNEDMKNC